MGERPLKDIINLKSFSCLLIVAIIILLAVIFPINYLLSKEIYSLSQRINMQIVLSHIKQFDNSLKVIEDGYNPFIKDIILDFRDKIESDNFNNLSVAKLEEYLQEVKEEFKPANILSNKEINFYLIDSSGMIIKTNYHSDLGLDFSNYPKLWRKIKGLNKGEILLHRLTYNMGRSVPRKYGYIKLKNGYILELGVPMKFDLFKELINTIKGLKGQLFLVKDLELYNGGFFPISSASMDIELGEQDSLSINTGNINGADILKRDLFNPKDEIYIPLTFEAEEELGLKQSYILKVNLDYSEVKLYKFLILLGLFLILMMIAIIIIILNKKIYQKLSIPFAQLAENMGEFKLDNNNDLCNKIDRTDIEEVNTLLATYQNMTSELLISFEEQDSINKQLKESNKKLDSLTEKLQDIILLTSSLTKDIFNEDSKFLSRLLKIAQQLLPEADYGSIYLIDEGEWKFIDAIGHDIDTLKLLILEDGYFPEEDVIIVDNIMKKERAFVAASQQEDFDIATIPIKSTLLIKLKVGEEVLGGISLDIAKDSKEESFSSESIKTMKSFGNIASAFLTMQRYINIRERFQEEIIFSIINILEIHDRYTRGHSENVASISVEIAKRLDFSSEDIKMVYFTGLVHDIGKILVDKNILNKTTRLTDEEFAEIKKHSTWGYQLLSHSKDLEEIAIYTYCHHERWDGLGYPQRLKGDKIPLVSQIICVADAWDSMVNDRVYRQKLSRKVAIKELKDNKGKQFAPQIVDIALELIAEGEF
jgi:HD-GYP domain-containing protein (c-di-GMP phosphodiesterase class II)